MVDMGILLSVMASESRGRTILLTVLLVLSPSLSVPLPCLLFAFATCFKLLPLDNPCPCRLPVGWTILRSVLHQFSVIHVRCFYYYQSDCRQTSPVHLTVVNLLLFSHSSYVQGDFFDAFLCNSASFAPPRSLVTVSAVASASILFLSKFATSNCCTPHRMESCLHPVRSLPPPANSLAPL